MLMGKEGGGVGKRVYIPLPLHSVSLSKSKRLGFFSLRLIVLL
jgi:hypothetical protein